MRQPRSLKAHEHIRTYVFVVNAGLRVLNDVMNMVSQTSLSGGQTELSALIRISCYERWPVTARGTSSRAPSGLPYFDSGFPYGQDQFITTAVT